MPRFEVTFTLTISMFAFESYAILAYQQKEIALCKKLT